LVWHCEHEPRIWAWLGFPLTLQEVPALWHASQTFEVWMWVADLPGAVLPLWQETQLLVIPA
jgi:hypothetical protein